MTSKTSYNNVGKYIWQQLRATRSFILLVAVIYMMIGPFLLPFQMNSLGMATNPLPITIWCITLRRLGWQPLAQCM